MKTPAVSASFTGFPQVGRYLLVGALLTGIGCVSQQTYDQTRAETEELTRTLDTTRAEVRDLEQRVAALQAANRQEDDVTTELRSAIQREQDMLPVYRQRADEKLAALQAQVARMVNQNRLLAREMASAKQETVSLQAMVTQYKQEIEEARSIPPLPPLPVPVASAPSASQSTVPPDVPSAAPITPPAPPQQTAQANPVDPLKQSTPTHLTKNAPEEVDESWTGMIKSWVSSLWSWIFD